jgi:cation transporter-like permease
MSITKQPSISLSLIVSSAILLLAAPFMAFAQLVTGTDAGPFETFVENIVDFTNNVLLPAVLAIAFFVFVWGIFKFFILGGANEEARENGKNLMIYATLGFVFIVIFWGLVNFVADTFGLQGDAITLPTVITI